VLNQDNSVNSSANPAPRGTVVQIFATGEGQTLPPGVTGSMTQSNLKKPVLPVCVMIGGVDAPLLYAGSAPDAIAGLLQINAVVPQTVSPGPAIPISIMIGDLVSPNGVTIAVQ
jgi:trimeric autotransporter adhesin